MPGDKRLFMITMATRYGEISPGVDIWELVRDSENLRLPMLPGAISQEVDLLENRSPRFGRCCRKRNLCPALSLLFKHL